MSSNAPAVDKQLEETATEEKAAEDSTTEKMSTKNIATEEVKKVHPYEHKLSSFKPNKWQLEKRSPQTVSPLEDDTFTFVDSITSLNDMMTELKTVKELGFSAQYEKCTHFYPTCCLLEISTRTRDYVVDPMKFKDELKVLNEVFADENVLKVCYSGKKPKPGDRSRRQCDLHILASALGVWVVNLFELARAGFMVSAGQQPNYNKMLKKYCFVDMLSLEQDNDWTVRPLSEAQLKYARMRSHYLLYIQDSYRNELIDGGRIRQLYDQCTNFCKSSASKADIAMGSHINLYRTIVKKEGKLNNRQMECLRLLFKWRYETAKENDKGVLSVMRVKDMFKLSKELPTEVEGVAKCFPDEVLPSLVESNLQVVHGLILQAIKEVTDLSIVKLEEDSTKKNVSTTKRGSAYKNDLNSNPVKRGRGSFHRGHLGHCPISGRGGFPHGLSYSGPNRGRGGMRPPMGPHMGPHAPRMGPWINPAMGSGMHTYMGQGYGHRMGPTYQNASYGAITHGIIGQVVDKVVGEMIHGVSYRNNMYDMSSQSRGRGRGGRDWQGRTRR